MLHHIIHKTLSFRKNEVLTSLYGSPNLHPLFKEVVKELFLFDFVAYKEQLYRELLVRIEAWWANPQQNSQPEQPLAAILLEYDNFFIKDCKASVYEIYNWTNQQLYTDCFDMGSQYNKATQSYKTPSISLHFFNGLYRLEYENLPDQYKSDPTKAIELCKGYYDVIALHQYEGMIAIHEVLCDLDEKKAFEGLHYKDGFMFLMTANDEGKTYPLLVKRKQIKP